MHFFDPPKGKSRNFAIWNKNALKWGIFQKEAEGKTSDSLIQT